MCVCVCVCVCVCMCVCIYLCVMYAHTHIYIHNGSLSLSGRYQSDNSYITHHIEPLLWKQDNLTNITNSCHANICPSPICTLSDIVSLSKLYVHAMCTAIGLFVWVLIMLFDGDLIHLFVADDILECRLQNINVTSFLTELTFTHILKLEKQYILFDV